MFQLGYLCVIAFAAVPLARTFLQASRDNQIAFVHRLYRDAAYLLVAVFGIICLEIALHISLENYWFDELGQSHRFWVSIEYRVGIFLAILLLVGAFLSVNLRLLCRPLPVVPRSAPWIISFTTAGLAGFVATRLWIPLMRFFGAAPTGTVDPVFTKDLSFYLLALPLYDGIVNVVIAIFCITIVLWLVLGYIARSGSSAVIRHPDPNGAFHANQITLLPPQSWADQASWTRQGMMLAALLCLALGASRLLARYHIVSAGHSTVVAGASFADVNFWIPAYNLMVVCWLATALILMIAVLKPQLRVWLLSRRSHWLIPSAALAILFIGSFAVPAAIEAFYVAPNQITLEMPFLIRSIAGTRQAYNLEGPSVEEREFAVSSKPLTAADIERNTSTLQDARIWDWRLEPQLQQIQGLRPYYTFSSVDIDRYQIDSAERQVIITARELDVTRLPAPAQVWVNLALKYTHGYGVVAVPVNEIDSRGNPVLWAHDIPIVAKKNLSVTHGEIYFGELTNDRVYVRTTEKELDFPQGQANAETIYQGSGGIPISNLWRKLVFAREFDALPLFLSGYFTPESRVILRRNIVERVNTLAPFLTFDRDPYIIADSDHYSYILDAYATSANYPYSESYQGSLSALRGQNYLRNSVKAVIDAYNGSVTFYVFDQKDPITRAYEKILPEMFKDAREMPPNLRRHIRYPEDLFTVQAEMYGTYHMTNPTTLYNREDRWEVPHELDREMLPYYVTTKLPGSNNTEFLLMLPLSVAGKNQMAGWLAGLCDGENYGKMVAFRFPKGIFVDGPAQVESRINSDSRFSGYLTLWDQHGSRVIRGNLLVLPLSDNQLIIVEPIYIEAEQTKIPTLARVVLGQLLPDDRKIEWASTLADAEQLLVGARVTAQQTLNTEATGDTLEQVRSVFREMQQQLAAGNFARYGELLQQMQKLLWPQ